MFHFLLLLAHWQLVTSSGASDGVCSQGVQHWAQIQDVKPKLSSAPGIFYEPRPSPGSASLVSSTTVWFSVWFRVSAAGCRSCLTAIRRKNKAFISGQHKYAYFRRLSQLLRIPAAKIARYGCERRDVECLQNALISPPPPLPPNTLVNLKSAMPGFVRQAV